MKFYNSFYPGEGRKGKGLDAWWIFFNKVIWLRSLVLYSQKSYISSWFKNYNDWSENNLDDSTCPWDWDHIHPENLIKNRKKLLQVVRNWHSTIGNLRAWPLELNRSDSDSSPANKFKFDYKNGLLKNYCLTSDDDLARASVIESTANWTAIDKNLDLKSKKDSSLLMNAIVCRFISIYKNWYDTLRVGELY